MRCAHGTLAGFTERRRLFQRRKAVQDRQLDQRAAGLLHLLKRSSTDKPYGAMPYSYCALRKLPRYLNRPTPQRAVCLLRRYRYRIQAS